MRPTMTIAPPPRLASTSASLARAKRLIVRALPHPLYQLYRKQRVASLIDRYSERIVTHSYHGHELKLVLADPLAESWYDQDCPRLREIAELTRLGALNGGATVFDLGAHQGVVALVLAAEVGPSGRVIAVEAQAHNAAIARRNIELNNASNVILVHAAVASTSGTVRFDEGLNGHVDGSTRVGTTEVDAVTIDQLAQRYGPPDLVFVDVEGYEGKALEGAAATLTALGTCFFVEVHTSQLVECTVSDLTDRFVGYNLLSSAVSPAGEIEGLAPVAVPLGNRRFFLLACPR